MTHITFDTFTPEERAIAERLDPQRVPRHVAVIMDGNGRWATRQGLPRLVGHHAGVESVRDAVRACVALGVEYLTLYSFSTENWSRPAEEIAGLMALIEEQLRTELDNLAQQHIRIRHIGRMHELPASLQEILTTAISRTRENTALNLVFAINYSGRAELLDATRRLAAEAAAGVLNPGALTEDDLARALYAPDAPNPDLLIRTADEYRVSNFLLWQIAYAELWVTPLAWPEFRAVHLLAAVEDFQHRQRKFGRVSS